MNKALFVQANRNLRALCILQWCESTFGIKRNISAIAKNMVGVNRPDVSKSLAGNGNVFDKKRHVDNFCASLIQYYSLSRIGSEQDVALQDRMSDFITNAREHPCGYFSEGRFAHVHISSLPSKQLTEFRLVERQIDDGGVAIQLSKALMVPFSVGASFLPRQLAEEGFPFENFEFENSATGEEANRIEVKVIETARTKIDLQLREKLIAGYNSLYATQTDRDQILEWLRSLDEGNNTYVRLCEITCTNSLVRPYNILSAFVSPTRFSQGMHNAMAEILKKLGVDTPNEEEILQRNLLATRIGVIKRDRANKYAVFQQRSTKNYKYPLWWDVGAAGYIRYKPEQLSSGGGDFISIVKEARWEIQQELRINDLLVPTSEGFAFFGITRNEATGMIDVIGQCEIEADAFERQFVKTDYVTNVRHDVPLEPSAIVNFLLREEKGDLGSGGKAYVVPSATITLVCMLRRVGFSLEDILDEFRRLYGRLEFDPIARGPLNNS